MFKIVCIYNSHYVCFDKIHVRLILIINICSLFTDWTFDIIKPSVVNKMFLTIFITISLLNQPKLAPLLYYSV